MQIDDISGVVKWQSSPFLCSKGRAQTDSKVMMIHGFVKKIETNHFFSELAYKGPGPMSDDRKSEVTSEK